MFGKILAGVDGSDGSVDAARVAAEMAQRFGGELTVLHVVEPPRTTAPFPGAPVLPLPVVERYVQDLHRAALNRVRPVIRECLPEFEVLEETGEPAVVIARIAEAQGFDLVVLGSRGLSPEKAAQMGSVSDGVAHRAHCPVLIVR
jgi:nucleotide-binding universal stress UspA family protein